MDTAAAKERIAEMSPRSLARMAGAFQLLEAITVGCGLVVLGRLVVSGNPAATAASIIGHQQLFWFGFALSLLAVVFHVAYAFLFYELLKPVNRRLSFFAMLVLLMATAVQALMAVFYLGPSLVLDASKSLGVFSAEHLQVLTDTFLKLHGYAFNIHLFLFGIWCLLVGILICRSTFLPRVLGVLLAIAGLGWMMYLVPPLANRIFVPYRRRLSTGGNSARAVAHRDGRKCRTMERAGEYSRGVTRNCSRTNKGRIAHHTLSGYPPSACSTPSCQGRIAREVSAAFGRRRVRGSVKTITAMAMTR